MKMAEIKIKYKQRCTDGTWEDRIDTIELVNPEIKGGGRSKRPYWSNKIDCAYCGIADIEPVSELVPGAG